MSLSRRHFLHHLSITALASRLPTVRAAEKRNALRVGTFYGYENSVVIATFEKMTGVKVDFVLFENTEEVVSELVRNEKNLDVAIASDFMLPHLATLGLIQPLQAHWLSKLNIKHLDRRFAHFATNVDQWIAWPNDWGTTGILYYRSKVSSPPKTWRDFFALIPQHKKKVSVPDDQTTVIGTALKALGYSFNDTAPQHLREAGELLRSIRPYIRSIDSDTDDTMLKDDLAMGWSDSAYSLQKQNPDLDYVLPPEGGELWSDWYTIPRHCSDVRAAHEFFNFVLAPENVVEDVINNGHSPVDTRVVPLLDEPIRHNKILFPSTSAIKNMEQSTQSALREPLRGELFAQFKANKW